MATIAGIFLAGVLILALPAPTLAWERHDLLTRPILTGERWLDTYRDIRVEAATSDDDPYNPSYVPVYIDRLPGEHETAREILTRYVDEPDWGMDTGIQASPWQALTGGSRGYRQRYYYFASGVVRVGDAPGRVEHFYSQAVHDMNTGHPYWAFRNLARSLFYLEELGEPLNTRPFPYSWLWRTRFDSKRLDTLVLNFSVGYGAFVEWHLIQELRSGNGPLLEVLRQPPGMPFVDPTTAALALAEFSCGQASALLFDLMAFFPERIQSMAKPVRPTPLEIHPSRPPASYFRIMTGTAQSLRITAGAVRSVLDLARKDFRRRQAPS